MKELFKKIINKIWLFIVNYKIEKKYKKIFHNIYPDKKNINKQKQKINLFKIKPLISIITPVYNPEKKYLIECIESVLNQTYNNWELCLVDDASTKPYVKKILKDYAKKDKRIKIKFRKTNGHICAASNDALKMARGEYVALLDHDDFLWPNALFEVVKLINKKPNIGFIYTDEDKINEKNKHFDPFFKPNFNLNSFLQTNYINHLSVIKKELIDKAHGFRIGFEGAQDWDLFLRIVEKIDTSQISHIPKILYSWRVSLSSTASKRHINTAKNYVWSIQEKVLKSYLKRNKINQKPIHSQYLGFWIIGNKNPDIIRKNYFNILKKTTLKRLKII